MKLRRILGFLIVLCLLAGLWSPVSAADNDADLEQAIIGACIYNREADLSAYDLTSAELETVFYRLYDEGKLPWYASDEYWYDYVEEEQEMALAFTPIQLYEGEIDIAAYEEAVARVLDAYVLPGMCQWQIALSLHDYLIANASYDETEEKNTGYDILVNRTAMCAGYALVYQDLLQRVGIDCLYVASDEMEHAWNLVCIDGSWYHADLTWDDPTPDAAGFVCHEYFLLTDEEISAGEDPHYGWDKDIPCTDTRFSDAFWKDIYSQICYESKDTSYLIRSEDLTNSVCRRDENTGEETRIYKETVRSIDIGYGRYKYEHHGLTLRDGRLWFNALNQLVSMNPDGTDPVTEYTHSGDTYIYGSHVSGDRINLTLMDHDGYDMPLSIDAPATSEHIHNFTRTVTEPTCTENGFTLSQCDCGLEATGTPTAALGHDYQVTGEEKATLLAEGSCTYSCSRCQDTFTETTPKLPVLDFLIDNAKLVILLPLALFFAIRAGRKKKKEKYTVY